MRALSCQIVIGMCCAAAFMLAGLWIWYHQQSIFRVASALGYQSQAVNHLIRLSAVWALAAGQFLFLYLVADELRPQAPAQVRWFIKAVVMAIFWLALIGVGYTCWTLA